MKIDKNQKQDKARWPAGENVWGRVVRGAGGQQPWLGALRPPADSPWETWGQHRDVKPQDGEEEKRKRKQGENRDQKDWRKSKKHQDV